MRILSTIVPHARISYAEEVICRNILLFYRKAFENSQETNCPFGLFNDKSGISLFWQRKKHKYLDFNVKKCAIHY